MVTDIEVVVESYFDWGTNPELRARKELLDRRCHQMGGAVPERVLAAVVLPFENLESGIGADLAIQIPDFAVDLDSERLTSQAFADALSNLEARDALVILPGVAVGKCYCNLRHHFEIKKSEGFSDS
jgi:hypothetical protein